MIRALWRAVRARRRLDAHVREHGDLRQVADLAGLRHQARAAGYCGLPLAGGALYCSERAGHRGEHRSHLGTVEYASAQPDPSSRPEDGAPRLQPPQQRARWRRPPPPPPPYRPGDYSGA